MRFANTANYVKTAIKTMLFELHKAFFLHKKWLV